MRETPFSSLVGCDLPLQLAGMGGGLSDVSLAAAVCDAGGLGVLGAGGLSIDAVRSMLDAMAEATDHPFGLNFLMPFIERDQVSLAAQRCRVCDFHFGDPDPVYVEIAHEGGALACWQVGSAEEAEAAAEAGCDIVVAQGVEAGGHVRGTNSLDELLEDVIRAVDTPVVAAGGIGTADRVRSLLDAGASAVRVGTRFVAATESTAHPQYIDALIAASAEDTEMTETFSADWPDAPHRVLRSCIEAANAATEDVVATVGTGGDAWPIPRLSSMPPVKEAQGNIAAMPHYAGTSVQHVQRRQPAAEIVAELCSQLS